MKAPAGTRRVSRVIAAGLVGLILVSALLVRLPATWVLGPPLTNALPSEAQVVVTKEADLTGDGVAELIVGYTVSRTGLPPTEGRAAVLERTPRGSFRRVDLEGAWGGHYLPRFTVTDLTGDGKPELVREVATGAAWEMLSVFQYAPGEGYKALLHDPGQSHLIWDANGDTIPEVVGQGKIDFPDHLRTNSFRWLGDRFIAWHTASWLYGDGSPNPAQASMAADLTGLTVSEAVLRAKRPVGMIMPKWITPILSGGRQVVHVRSISGPAYIYRLSTPWTVFAGGRSLSIRVIGVPLESPYKGLVLLGEDGSERSPLFPRFETAIYTADPVIPPSVPSPRPLKQYLSAQPELEAFVTLAPESWQEALRLRGIQAERWPDPDPKPALAGSPPAPSPYTPVPEHAVVTVLNGRVRQARRQGEHVWIDLEAAPGEVQRWPMPLIGFAMGMTPYVHILGPNPAVMALHTPIPITQWHGPPQD